MRRDRSSTNRVNGSVNILNPMLSATGLGFLLVSHQLGVAAVQGEQVVDLDGGQVVDPVQGHVKNRR